MNQNSRVKNSAFNFITNVMFQFISIITAFIIRRVFINTLGVEFLGIAGLFNNVLAVLSLAELGVGSAVSYSMYKAIAESDKDKLAALNNFYRTIYNRISICVLIIGISLLPFLKYIVKLDINVPHLYAYYVLEVLNSVFSYLFIYKTAIVNADQSGYKLNKLSIVLQIIKFVLQIVSLICFKKYMLYILAGICVTIFGNVIKSIYSEKWYPFIKDRSTQLSEVEKKEIWNNIKAMFLYRISGIVLNNTDNILISVIINTKMVGYYSNYFMINTKLHAILTMFFTSIYSSVGNLNATESKERRVFIFKVISLLSFWLYGLGTIGFYFCGEDIVRAITGSEQFVLGKDVLIACVILFYFNVLKQPILVYRETSGLFRYGKYSIVCSAILNIILSIILGLKFGVFGIVISSCISRFCCDIWYEPFVLFKRIFKESPRYYFLEQLKYAFVFGICITLLISINSFIDIKHLYLRLGVEAVLCFVISNLVFLLVFFKTKEFSYIKDKILLLAKKR